MGIRIPISPWCRCRRPRLTGPGPGQDSRSPSSPEISKRIIIIMITLAMYYRVQVSLEGEKSENTAKMHLNFTRIKPVAKNTWTNSINQLWVITPIAGFTTLHCIFGYLISDFTFFINNCWWNHSKSIPAQ